MRNAPGEGAEEKLQTRVFVRGFKPESLLA